jgi:teichuronic acid biosynthesis glycosyltransferase TuaH
MLIPMTKISMDNWKNLVVLCAANSYNSIKVADQHMAEHLARFFPVLYVDPPISLLTAYRKPERTAALQGSRLRVLDRRLARLIPVVQPFPSRWGMTPLTSILTRRLLRNAICLLGADVQAMVSAWARLNVFGACDERVRIYWAQDDFVAAARDWGHDARTTRTGEARRAAEANFVVAANPGVAEKLRLHGCAPLLIPFGADIQTYEGLDRLAPASEVDLPAPVAGLVGRINDRIEISLLEAVAARGRSLLIVGPRSMAHAPDRWSALLRRPNVRWVGPKGYEELPRYLRVIDVGLVPYGDTPFNRGSFPLKTLEYLAGGRPVVATSLPATCWLATDLITIADEPTAFADAVDHWLDEPRTEAAVKARRDFAKQHSWARRAGEMANLINSVPPRS